MNISIFDFLEREIIDSKNDDIQLIEWRPALSAYGDKYLKIIEESVEFIKHSYANYRTVSAFGKKWFKNFFKNLEIVRYFIQAKPISGTILVCGAGPGLETAIPIINKNRNNLFIIAASSSLPALNENNILPNLIISTDGGSWAKFHLYEILRTSFNGPIITPLYGSLISQLKDFPFILLSDNSLWQGLLLRTLNLPFIDLPQRGTVSASALDFAFTLGKDVYIAGMDLENRDLLSHARPYSFDRFLYEKEKRIEPYYSQTFKRSTLLKEGGSYSIYASWFKKQLSSYPEPIQSLGINNSLFGSSDRKIEKKIHSGNKQTGISDSKIIQVNKNEKLSKKAKNLLLNFLDDQNLGKQLCRELGLLLLQNESAEKNEIKEVIHSLSPG